MATPCLLLVAAGPLTAAPAAAANPIHGGTPRRAARTRTGTRRAKRRHKMDAAFAHQLMLQDAGVERLVVADDVTRIPSCAYTNWSELKEVVLPASVVSIRNGAFRNCSGIVDLQLPATLQAIDLGAFYGCSGITNLHLPDTLLSISTASFRGCSGIVDLQLPCTLQAIGGSAFSECEGIVDLHPPGTLQSIGASAFKGCSRIATLVLPEGLTTVAHGDRYSGGAFQGCTNLARVLAPDSLVRGEMADPAKVFEGCPVLATCGRWRIRCLATCYSATGAAKMAQQASTLPTWDAAREGRRWWP